MRAAHRLLPLAAVVATQLMVAVVKGSSSSVRSQRHTVGARAIPPGLHGLASDKVRPSTQSESSPRTRPVASTTRRFGGGVTASSSAWASLERTLMGAPLPTCARRSYVQAFLRTPAKAAVPSVSVKGEPIDRDVLFFQFNNLVDHLRQSALIDTVHLMEEFPGGIEAVQTADLVTSYGSEAILLMPQQGKEQRQAELAETMRYLRASGARGTAEDLLQKEERAKGHAGDFVILPECLLIAESSRTNRWTIEMLRTAFSEKEQYKAFTVYHAKVSDTCPPLNDIVAYAGEGKLLYWNNDDGRKMAQYIAENVKRRNWELVAIPVGTQVISFYSGSGPREDVLVDDDNEEAIDAISSADLNVIPVEWSEWKKLGITMRSMCLVLRFARGGFAGGGVRTHSNMLRSSKRVHTPLKQSRKDKGQSGSPLWAQLRNQEIEVCYQPPPRYAPPMHRPGPLVTTPPPP